MDVAVDLDEETVRELEEEAQLQGFADLKAYLSWIVAHRPMSELAGSQAPAVASRVSELEERMTLVERQLGLDEPADPDADLGGVSGADGGSLGGGFEPAAGDSDSGSGGEALEPESGPESESEPGPEAPGDAAEDDEIAEVIGDVSLEDEDKDETEG